MVGNQINPENKQNLDNKKLTEDRKIRGYSILAKGDTPLVMNENEYYVPSQSDSSKKYKVTHVEKWDCECPDFKHRCKDNGLACKHIQSIHFYLQLKSKAVVDSLEIDKEFNEEICINCKGKNIVKFGVRKNKSGIKQRYTCKDCNKKFVLEPIKYIKGNAKLITLTMDLYFKGLSLRDISDTIKQFYNLDITHETVRRWIRTFTRLMNEYTKKFKPELSERWHMDEQKIKVGKDWLWSWNVLDKDTRFLVANNVTKSRYKSDVKAILDKTTELGKPKQIVTDGLQAYRGGIKRQYGYNNKKGAYNIEHIRARTIREHTQNNLVERYHNEFREWDKVKRGFGNKETAQEWNEGFRLFHNFIKKGIDNLTPSERAKINLMLGNNRWLDLLKQALNQPNMTKVKEVEKST